MPTHRPYEILLAEDAAVDTEMVRLALQEHRIECTLHLVNDGAQAIELLDSMDAGPTMRPLDLCILDMHLAKRDGEAVLNRLRSTVHYATTPVIAMSGLARSAPEDLAANGPALVYFTKPSSVGEYLRLGSIVKEVLQKNPDKENGERA